MPPLRQKFVTQALRSAEQFLQLLQEPRALTAQSDFLQHCLRTNQASAFGQAHQFPRLTTADDFRAAVPIRHYEEMEDWIERAVESESGVLTSDPPVRFWKTTGTTSQAKKIPVTAASAARTWESFLTLQGFHLRHYPDLARGADTTLVAHLSPRPLQHHLGPRHLPYCSTTEAPIEVRPGREDLVAPWLLPLQQQPPDEEERLFFLLSFAAAHDLVCISCLHPSRFQTILNSLQHNRHRLIAQLRRGPLARPELAERLEGIGQDLSPRHLWPNLQYVSSWSGAYLSRYRGMMRDHFSPHFYPAPSVSSEVFLTMPIDPDPDSQPLHLRGGFFEFVPGDRPVLPDSPTLLAHELCAGQTYEVVYTTQGGLYRYASCDIFRVERLEGVVPRLQYVGRRSVSDLTGEKLAEVQAQEGVLEVLSRHQMENQPFVVCAQLEPQPHYALALESPPRDPGARARLAEEIDATLAQINSRYQMKRNFGDLQPLVIEPLPAGTLAHYRRQRIQSGLPAGQVKDPVLSREGEGLLARLKELASWT